MEWIVVILGTWWFLVEVHHHHKRKCKFKIVATLILTEDGMKINLQNKLPFAAGIVKQTISFTGSEAAPLNVDLTPAADPTQGSIAVDTPDLTGTYTIGQQVAATMTQTDSLGTVSPATAFDFTLVGDVVAAPDASGVVATLKP